MLAIKPFDAPIPGENFTSDTKNYPWHRPPKFTDLDTAIEYMIKKIVQPDVAESLFTFMGMGVTVASLVDMLVTEGIGQGKWTVDYGVLMAGPLAHIICLMAKAYDVPYDLGIKQSSGPSRAMLNEIKKDQKKQQEAKLQEHDPFIKSILAGSKGNFFGEGTIEPQTGGFAALAGQSAGPMAGEQSVPQEEIAPEEQTEGMM